MVKNKIDLRTGGFLSLRRGFFSWIRRGGGKKSKRHRSRRVFAGSSFLFSALPADHRASSRFSACTLAPSLITSLSFLRSPAGTTFGRMRGFEDFFSPLLPQPVNTVPAAVRRPWDGQEEERTNSSSGEHDPTRRSSPSSPAGALSSELPSQHPELAPPSASSFGSIPSPVREVGKSGAYSRTQQ